MTRKLLLADDSITMQRLVSLTFADEDIEVISVGDGPSVIRRVKEIRPDIILVDVFLPGKNGYEICEFIKSNLQWQHVPVLLLVGTFEPLDPAEAQRVKADDHLTKPFESTVLINKVKDLLAKAAAAPQETAQEAAKETDATPHAPTSDEPPKAEIPAAPPPASEPRLETEPSAPAPVLLEPAEEATPKPSASPAFAVAMEASVGNSHPPAEDPLGNLLELDLDATSLEEKTNSFMVAPILDIYTDSASDDYESASAPVGVSTAVETEVLEPFEAPASSVEPVVAVEPHAPPVTAVASEPSVAPIVSTPVAAPAPVVGEPIPDAWIEAIAQRVVQKLSDSVIREIAWEVVPELSELIIREQVQKTKKSPKTS